MPLRVITVVISVLVCVAKGTYAAKLRKYLHIFTLFCDLFTWIDIILKFFLAYYNEKGILITNLRKTSAHYMMRGFVPDVIGVIPWGSIVAYFFTTPTTQSTTLLYDSYSRTLHVYLFLGYCNYWCDSPDANLVPMMIFKWQVLSFIMVNVMAHHLSIYCMDIVWDSHTFDYIRTELVMYDNETCFFIGASANMNDTDLLLHWISAKSFIISQFSFLKLIISKAVLEGVAHVNVLVVFLMLGTESLFWCVEIYTITMLVLSFRGPSLYEDNIDQLIVFLKNERVEEELINNVRTYFKYWWYRTHGMDVINPMMERVGLQLRQEISFQLFEITFQNLSHTLPISPHVKRHLACVCQVVYFLPRQDIIREMNLVPFVYIVYRGQVGIFKNGVKVNTLKKGAMFGHLRPGKLRPVVITAKTEQSTDVLQIPVDSFFRYIEDETLKGIFDTPESENNYIPLQRYFTEFGEETIQYLMRGVPSIRFPRSTRVISIRDSKWFSAWLTAVWLVTPALASFFTFIRFCNCPDSMRLLCRLVNLFTDIIHFIYVVVDFSFAQQLVVIGGKCRYRPIKWKKFKSVRIYTDIISLVVPKFRFVPYTKTYLNLARCLRLQYFYVFYQHFCTNFQSKTKTIAVFLVSIMLATHAIVCLELLTSCEDFDDVIKSEVPSSVVKNIIGVAFIPSDMREGGCVLTAHTNYTPSDGGPPRQALYTYKYKDWYGDYLCTLSELIQQDMMVRDLRDYDDYFSRWEIFLFGSIKSYALYFMNFLIMSKALTYIYIKFRKMFHYDHDCRNLEIFLLNVKLTYTLFQSVQMYLKKFWQRQKATGTPELVKRAPQCLKQDIMCSLYLHHLTLPGTFRDLPRYFLRQLTAKMHRTIIFPGKDIVKEGDILPVIFFIHEGEVEKYYLNKNSEKRVVTLLTTTGYFELMPVIFPNTPYQFSYQSKTVVDLVYLRNQDWTLLLDIYPEVKKYIYQTARSSKESMVKHP